MQTSTVYTSNGARWGSSGFTSNTDYLYVGKSGTATYYGRIGFPAINKTWYIKSIKLRMRRIDGYSSKALKVGSRDDSSWDYKTSTDFTKNISVSSGTNTKEWDLTAYKGILQGYTGTWYLHVRHGSGDNSYCEFSGGTSGSAPRLVIEYEEATMSIPTEGFTIGSGTDITVGTEGTGLTHTLNYTVGEYSGTICAGVDGGHVKEGWTPPLELANAITSGTRGTIVMMIISYLNGEESSRIEFSYPLDIPESMIPAITNVTYEVVNPENDDIGVYVQTRSKTKCTITAHSVYSAKIEQYILTIGGKSYTVAAGEDPEVPVQIMTDVLMVSGNLLGEVRVVDTRAREAEWIDTQPIVVHPYAAPVITAFSAERADHEGISTNSGTFLKYSLSCSFSPIGNLNMRAGSIKFRSVDDDFGDPILLACDTGALGSVYNFTLTGLLGQTEDPDEGSIGSGGYVVSSTLADRFGNSVNGEAELASRTIWFDLHGSGEGVAIGKPATDPSKFDVGIASRFRGAVDFDVAPAYANHSMAREALGIYCGHSTVSVPGSPTQYINVAFGKMLPAIPTTLVAAIGVSGGMTSTYHSIDVTTAVTTTGFRVKINNGSTGSATVWVDWIAIL